jgi:hypothetical protein
MRRQRATPGSSPISSARGWPKATTTNTAITTRYRCSTTDNATNANPGLPPQSARADHGQRRQACPATHPSSISRDRTLKRTKLVVEISQPPRFSLLPQGAALRAARRPGRCRWPAFPLRASPSGPAAAARLAERHVATTRRAQSSRTTRRRTALKRRSPAPRLSWPRVDCPCSLASKRPETA